MTDEDIRDFEFYSDDNPFIMYCGNKSYCRKCKKFFKGKSGAQSHSSKIHHLTLDGRELKPIKKIVKKIMPKTDEHLISQDLIVENKPNDDETFANIIHGIDDVLNLNYKLVQMEKQGLGDAAYKIRQKFGIFSVKEEKSVDNGIKTMLYWAWINEQDDLRKNNIFKLFAMTNHFEMSDDEIFNAFMMIPPSESHSLESSVLTDPLMVSLLLQSLQNMNRDPIDDIIRIKTISAKKSTFLDDFGKCVIKLHSPNVSRTDTSSNIIPPKTIRPPLNFTKHVTKTPPIRCVLPLCISKFTKNESLDFTFDAIKHSLNYADMNLPFSLTV